MSTTTKASDLSNNKKNMNNLTNQMEKYEVISSLGEGSFGRVFKAKLISDSSYVALKIMSKVSPPMFCTPKLQN